MHQCCTSRFVPPTPVRTGRIARARAGHRCARSPGSEKWQRIVVAGVASREFRSWRWANVSKSVNSSVKMAPMFARPSCPLLASSAAPVNATAKSANVPACRYGSAFGPEADVGVATSGSGTDSGWRRSQPIKSMSAASVIAMVARSRLAIGRREIGRRTVAFASEVMAVTTICRSGRSTRAGLAGRRAAASCMGLLNWRRWSC